MGRGGNPPHQVLYIKYLLRVDYLIENGLVMMRIPYWWTFSVFGGIIIFSVIIAKIIEARRMAST